MLPVYPEYFADPFVWKHGGEYFAVGTGPQGVFPILRSPNLGDWRLAGNAMSPLHPDYGDTYWAPEVAYADRRFWLYYSVGRGDKMHHLRVAVSDRPEGPYEDTGSALTSTYTCPFAIDASPFQDGDGVWYLFYARDFLDSNRPGTALVVDRLDSMTQLAHEEKVVLRAAHDWQRFESDRVMYGGRYDWHTLEGPCVRKHNDRYFCFYSSGRWENETYGVDYAVADRVTGPYRSTASSSGPRLLKTKAGSLIGPGHNSILNDGDADYIVYHAWDTAMTGRRMFIDRLDWSSGEPDHL